MVEHLIHLKSLPSFLLQSNPSRYPARSCPSRTTEQQSDDVGFLSYEREALTNAPELQNLASYHIRAAAPVPLVLVQLTARPHGPKVSQI